MQSWQEKLDEIPRDGKGWKQIINSTTTKIVLEFMRDEIFPLLQKATNDFIKNSINAKLYPESALNISEDNLIVYILINFNNFTYRLEFKNKSHYEIVVELIGKYGSPKLGNFYIDRMPESPTIFIESYLRELREQLF